MNKIFGLGALAIIFTVVSCSTPESKKEVIVVPAPVEKKEPVVVVVKDTPSTSVILNKKGVQVQTKKVKVDIKP